VFYMDIAKIDWDVAYIAKCSRGVLHVFLEACCKYLFKIFHLFHKYVASVFYLDVVYISQICCKSVFKIFHLFQSYAAISAFMLQVASVLSGCCICFTHMFQVYVLNV
jgi:hypothetical protein